MIKWIVAAACLAVGVPGSAMAQDAWRSPAVAEQMVLANSVFGGDGGYTPTVWSQQADVKGGGDHLSEISIFAGDRITMVAVCDEACGDLDMQVFDPSGQKVGVDEAKSKRAVVQFTAETTGMFKIRVMMVACSAPTCAVGVKGFWKHTQASQASPPAQPAKPTPQQAQSAAKTMPSIMVAGPNKAPMMLVGITGFGPDSSLTKMETAAAAAGLGVTERVVGGEQIDHTMIVFKPGADAARAREFYRQANNGGFGFLMVEVMLVSPDDAKDGITSADVRTMPSDAVKEL